MITLKTYPKCDFSVIFASFSLASFGLSEYCIKYTNVYGSDYVPTLGELCFIQLRLSIQHIYFLY